MKRIVLLLTIVTCLFSTSFAQTGSLYFINGSAQSITLCQNSAGVVLDNYLITYDKANGLTLTYTLLTTPAHGTIHGFPGISSSNGGVASPSGFTYNPTTGYSGSDVFEVQVTDGVNTAKSTFTVAINSLPTIAPITGGTSLCGAGTKTLSDNTTGGIWTSSNTFSSIIDSLTGVVTGVSAGQSTIGYTVTSANGCTSTVTTTFTISGNPLVSGITGTTNVCVGSTTTLADVTANGVWSSNNTAIATVSGGVVTGVSAGNATIQYKVTNIYGCSTTASRNVTVNAIPVVAPITSTTGTNICGGGTITLRNATARGTWSSTNNSIATVNALGVVTGVSGGIDTIIYTVSNGGCSASSSIAITVGVTPVIGAISGVATICNRTTYQFSDTTKGGKWTSSNPLVASIDSSTGLVTAIAAGNITITYTVVSATGCSASVTAALRVVNIPSVGTITGANYVCIGSTSTLVDGTAGGVWSSTNTQLATIDNSGLVTGLATGVDTIYYTVTNASGCSNSARLIITVGASVAVPGIGGASNVCLNSTLTLTNKTTGGSWSSSDPTIAFVDNSGLITPINPGVVTISYTVGNGACTGSAIKNIIVSDVPTVDNNNLTALALCTTDSAILTNTTSGGLWTSNTSAATVTNDGIVKGISTGSGTITYTVTNSYGCFATSTTGVTVNAKPNAFTITGSNATCVNNIINLKTTGTGGLWSSSNTKVATVNVNGTVSGKSSGTASIYYTITNGNGCARVDSMVVTIAKSLTVAPIVGNTNLCLGTATTFTDSTINSSGTQGTWALTLGTGSASVNASGVVTPVALGTATLSYTVNNGSGCTGSVSQDIVINSAPTVAAIAGPTNVCAGATITLTDATVGGVWSTNNATIAIIDSNGVLTGITGAAGGGGGGANRVVVTYAYTDNIGCKASKTYNVNVRTGPGAGFTTGVTNLCVGSTSTFTNNTQGGTWASDKPSVATVDNAGLVTGVSAGSVVIQYIVSNGNGCPSVANSKLTVDAVPVVAKTTGIDTSLCVGQVTQLFNASSIPTGGTAVWSSSNTAIAKVSATGVVTAVSAGTANIIYTVTNAAVGGGITPCNSATSISITVSANPVVSSVKASKSNVCVGSNITVTDATAGGTWGINDTTLATIDPSTGVVTGVSSGSIIVTYTVVKNGCTTTVFGNGTVVALPEVAAIVGNSTLCQGFATLLTDTTTGGVWSTSDASVANVSSNGNVTTGASGSAVISYTVTNPYGCVKSVTDTITVNPLPIVTPIIGNSSLCIGSTYTVTDSTSSGVWLMSNTVNATINSNGIVTPLVTGVDTVIYSVTNVYGCKTTVSLPVSVNPTPIASFTINKSSQCLSDNYFIFTNTSTISSGSITPTWSLGGTVSNSINPTNVFSVAGIDSVILTETSNAGCISTASQVVTVNPQPVVAFAINDSSQCLTGNSFTFTNNSSISTGTQAYSWNFGDGSSSVTTTSPTYAYVKAGTYKVQLTATSNNGCIDSLSQTVMLTANVVPSVSIKANTTSICTGSNVVFTATPVNGGSSPYYQWYKNGLSVGSNSSTYNDNLLVNGDAISCVLASSVKCLTAPIATSNSIVVSVSQYSTPSVTISSSADTICAGTSITFTAEPVNGGGTPIYQWQVNGVNAGTNSSTFTTNTLNDKSVVTCNLTSSVTCVTSRTISSNAITITVHSLSTSTTNASICAGASYTFNGNVYTTSGTYISHLTNVYGCDSAATLVLNVKATSASTTKASICLGGSYLFNGTTYTTAGTYTAHLTNAVGCDSTATLLLTVNQPSTSTTNESICNGSSYTFNGTVYTKAGTYTAHLTNSVGCDSAATLILTVKSLSTSTTSASICANASYPFNGTVYTTAGTYTAHLINAVGCDSAATLILTVKSLSTSTTVASICAGGNYTFNGTVYTTAGTYTAHLTNAVGCDSAATLILSVKSLSSSTTNASICADGSYTFNGNTYKSAGTYVAHLTNAVGCDSTATLVLTIKSLSTSTTTASICAGNSYTFNGTTYTSAGSYTAHLTNSVSCDSAATLILSVNQPSTSITIASICAGSSFTFNGRTYTSAGSYDAHLTNAVGCDSAATLILTVKATSSSITNVSICAGDSYTFNGSSYTSSGSYIAHLTNSVGCDSAATLILTVKSTSSSTTNASICSGGYTFNGTTYTTSGTYTAHLTNSVGCDSTATLVLSVKYLSTSITKASICEGTSYKFNGIKYTSAGSYIAHLTNSVGCDSAATLILTVNQPSTSTTNASICAGSSYTFNGSVYTGAGSYVAHLTNAVGCDSAATLILTVKATSTSITNASICAGSSYSFNGSTYTSTGSYVAHLTNSLGCDSAATLNLTVKELSSSITNASICSGSSYSFNGNVYTTSGTYVSHLTNSVGCDSSATLNLTVKSTSTSTTNANICSGVAYDFNGTSYTKAGTYVAHLTNSVGCDSAATLILTVTLPVTPTLTLSATATTITVGTSVTFTARPTNSGGAAIYQWYKNGALVTGFWNTYTTSSLNNNDTISCVLTSSMSCVTNVTAKSNAIVMTVNYLYTINGTIKSPLGTVIPTVTVGLNGNQSIITDLNGNYSFTVSADSSFIVMPTKSNDVVVANGVNGTDISLVQSHILKKVILNSPYKLIAADVNNDGVVNGTDIALIKSLILKRINKFSGNRLWAFVDSSYSFPTPTKPFPYNDSISVANIRANQVSQNFVGVKLGDVNYDWNSSILGANLASSPIELFNDKIAVSPSASEVRVPVKVKNFKNIMGMQYTLNYNSAALELKSIDKNSMGIDYNTDFATEGKLPFLWVDVTNNAKTLEDGTTLFELVFNKKGNLANEDISLTSDITSASAFDGNYGAVCIVKSGGTISDAATIVSADNWNILPNPTKDGLVKVTLSLAKSKKVQFELTSLDGKLLLQQSNDFPIGNSSIVLDLQRQVRLAPGTYYLKAEGVDGVNTKQVLFIK